MRISIRHIQKMVAQDFGIPIEQMRSRSRVRKWAGPRQAAMLMARELTPLSLPSIGKVFDRDHSTVVHGIRAALDRANADRNLSLKLEARMLLLLCEPQKVVDAKNIGFPLHNPQSIHRSANPDLLDDPLARAA